MSLRVLYVCTANICRSASAARLLREAADVGPMPLDVEVLSAGTGALPGSPGCRVAPALHGHAAEHSSQPVTSDLIGWADLVLPAARDHREAIVSMDASARTRTFTIRQAGRLADWLMGVGMVEAGRERAVWEGASPAQGWAERFPPGDPRAEVVPLAGDPGQRWAWLVDELDAARGMVVVSPPPAVPEQGRRWWMRSGREDRGGSAATATALSGHPDDVPDPHVLGMGLHDLAYEQIRDSTDALVRLLRSVDG